MGYSSIVPGINNNLGSVYGVIEMYNLNSIIQSIELLEEMGDLNSNDYQLLQQWFRRLLEWCLQSRNGKKAFGLKDNVGTAYDITVVRIALFIKDLLIVENIMKQFKAKRIKTQIGTDGSQPYELSRTNSFGYSIANLRYLLDMQILMKSYKGKTIGFKKMDRALKWLDYNYVNRATYKYQQISGWKHIPNNLADLYWMASKCRNKKYYLKLYQEYKKLSNTK